MEGIGNQSEAQFILDELLEQLFKEAQKCLQISPNFADIINESFLKRTTL